MAFINKRNRAKHINQLQEAMPYETPLNVRQIANLSYGDGSLMADYYEPMPLTRAETPPDKSTMPVAVLLYDDPVAGGRGSVMHLAMEFARRGLAVYAVEMTHGNKDGKPFFLENLDNLFAFLSDVALDKHRLGLHCQTYATAGNKVILIGCGTGATLAGLAMRLYYNARLREYFAALCPNVRRYFAMGNTPSVDFNNLIRIGGFVSISGYLCPAVGGNEAVLAPWCGHDYMRTVLATHLDFTRYLAPDYPPVLLVTSLADTTRAEALAVHAVLPPSRCRLIDLAAEDEKGYVLENQFNALYPLWDTSKDVNVQIVAFCKGV